MKTQWELFCGPSGLAISYEEAVKDVRRELDSLVLKTAPEGRSEEFKQGWNAALVALSKKIRIEKGRRPGATK